MVCQICHCQTGQKFEVPELMFGTRDLFHYFECDKCGCLQLIDPPDDFSPYYPQDQYYSLQTGKQNRRRMSLIRSWVKRHRDASILFQQKGLFRWFAEQKPNPGIDDLRNWLSKSKVRSYSDRILDIGCGNGELLYRMQHLGFNALTGYDPYLPEDQDSGEVRLLSSTLEFLPKASFQLIMLHHSFEHLPNPRSVLIQVRQLLSPDGVCLIRIPIKSNGPWKMYGTNWAEIDAPRHIFLHTEMSIKRVALDADLLLKSIDYEDEPFSYFCSEHYQRGGSLYANGKRASENWKEFFTNEELNRLEKISSFNNVPGWASRAAFYLTHNSQDMDSDSRFLVELERDD